MRFTLRIGLRKLGKRSSQVLPLVVEWIQENEDSKVVGNGIDILWDLVIG